MRGRQSGRFKSTIGVLSSALAGANSLILKENHHVEQAY